jgi:hypothetical protein
MQFNKFRASSCPSSEATTIAVAASGLPSELGDSNAVGRGRAGRAGPTTTNSFYVHVDSIVINLKS